MKTALRVLCGVLGFCVFTIMWPVGCVLVLKTGTTAIEGFFGQPFELMLIEALACFAWLSMSPGGAMREKQDE